MKRSSILTAINKSVRGTKSVKHVISLTILILIGIVPISAQKPIEIFSVDSSGQIVTNSRHLKCRYSNRVDTLDCSPQITLPVSVGKSQYTITLSSYDLSKAYSEGGDFGVITVKRDGKVIYEYRSEDWLLKFSSEYSRLLGESVKACAVNDFFIEIPLTATSKALVFNAYEFSAPPLPPLTILALTEEDAKVVHNRNIRQVSVDRDANNNILMTTCSNTGTTYGEMSIYTPPTLNTIWAEDGKLLFKDNHAELPMWGMWHYEHYRDGDGSKSPQIDFWLYLNLDGDKINGFHTLTYQESVDSAEIVDASSLKYLDKTIYGVLHDSVAQITIKSKYNENIPPIKAEINISILTLSPFASPMIWWASNTIFLATLC